VSKTVRRLLYRAVSSKIQSRIAGRISDLHIPPPALDAMMKLWIDKFGVNMDEAVVPEGGFPSFNAFFTRRLKPGMRSFPDDPDAMSSPCDGMVQTAGVIRNGMVFQAKGIEYSLADLLADSADATRFDGGHFLTIYLSPGDYHRVHFPAAGDVEKVRHIQGGLLSVAPKVVELFNEVFGTNERVTGVIRTSNGAVCMVMVGATTVGRISLSFSDVVTNTGHAHGICVFGPPVHRERGDEYGAFNLGSTVIVLVEKNRWTPAHPAIGQKIRLGQSIFTKN
jgi:phosphatidylserine decarboxylase